MTSALVVKDFDIPIAPEMGLDTGSMSIDEAIDAICVERGWPLIGGSSGSGWSKWGVAQRCPRLFQETYERGGNNERLRQETLGGGVPIPLQVGALFHTLCAFHDAAQMGENVIVAPERKGLCATQFRGPGRVKLWAPDADVPEQLLAALKAMCGVDEATGDVPVASDGQAALPQAPTARAPSLTVVLEAERLFDAHASHWGKCEDVTPLAVEWFASDERLNYTCRYDKIGLVGANDPVAPPGVYVFERKSSKWIDEMYLEGWMLDGEPLGQILLWEPSGCAKKFGPLAGVIIDVVSKAKVPECKRIVLPPTLPAAQNHKRWINYVQGQVALWRSMGVYPQYFGNCHNKFGRCANWNNCVTATE